MENQKTSFYLPILDGEDKKVTISSMSGLEKLEERVNSVYKESCKYYEQLNNLKYFTHTKSKFPIRFHNKYFNVSISIENEQELQYYKDVYQSIKIKLVNIKGRIIKLKQQGF